MIKTSTRPTPRVTCAAHWVRNRLCGALVTAGLVFLPAFLPAALGGEAVQSQEPVDPGASDITHFTKARWSMITPDKDYEGGCVVGFLAFSFSPTGYFSYNNHIHGSWVLDELGNLKLRTRNGVRFTMIVEGTTMRPSRTIDFMRRNQVFQRCPE